jgi:hypothetical protein
MTRRELIEKLLENGGDDDQVQAGTADGVICRAVDDVCAFNIGDVRMIMIVMPSMPSIPRSGYELIG